MNEDIKKALIKHYKDTIDALNDSLKSIHEDPERKAINAAINDYKDLIIKYSTI